MGLEPVQSFEQCGSFRMKNIHLLLARCHGHSFAHQSAQNLAGTHLGVIEAPCLREGDLQGALDPSLEVNRNSQNRPSATPGSAS